MGRLLTTPWGEFSPERESEPQPRVRLTGALDPLTTAEYRWRIVSGRYDDPALLDVLAERIVQAVPF
jgi:hypothetical protein